MARGKKPASAVGKLEERDTTFDLYNEMDPYYAGMRGYARSRVDTFKESLGPDGYADVLAALDLHHVTPLGISDCPFCHGVQPTGMVAG